jgi:hypothetical protein
MARARSPRIGRGRSVWHEQKTGGVAIDDHRLAGQHLAVDLVQRERRITQAGVRMLPPGSVLIALLLGLG